MPKYRAVRTLEAVDRAYIAELIDGEGSITLTRSHNRASGSDCPVGTAEIQTGKLPRGRCYCSSTRRPFFSSSANSAAGSGRLMK